MPIVLAVVTIPACGGCCGEVGLQWRCESLTGTATICGISGYRPDANLQPSDDPSAPWQYRKWAKRKLSGEIEDRSGNCTACEGTAPADTAGSKYEYSGTTEFTCEGQQSSGLLTFTGYGDGGEEGCIIVTGPTDSDVDTMNDASGSLNPVSTCSEEGSGPARPVVQAYTLTTRTLSGCGCHVIEDGRAFETVGTAQEELDEEQYLFDALHLANPDDEPGDSCCSQLTDAELTTPESLISISITGTGVRVRLFVLNGDPMGTYSITITTSQENVDDDPTITVYVVEVPGAIPTYFYVPISEPGDFPICVQSVVLNEP